MEKTSIALVRHESLLAMWRQRVIDFRNIGPADYITGSGIITYHWKLDDGSVANATFNYDSRVMTLIIVKDGEASEMIFR